tara:strand:+ start:2713 stop:4083 length:1371 start_codon:yes stop_codon:yes gene_type:complete
MLTNKNIKKIYLLFISSHMIIWVLVPALSNVNLPLDTIEALAWGSNLDWGFNKHPPLSAFAAEVFYQIFGNKDWAYYFLSQIFVITAFTIILILAYEIFQDTKLAFISVILLESIFFYNYTSPEFNVNIAQLPFWALSTYFTWRCLKYDKLSDYVFLGLFIGLGILSKYLFLFLALSIKLLFIYIIYKKRKFSFKIFIPGLISLVVLFPHFLWLIENDFVTIAYGFQRAEGLGNSFDHIRSPTIFIFKQIGILIPFFILFSFLINKFKYKKNNLDERKIFLIFLFLVPIVLVIFTSLILGAKIRTMWMTPFYLLIGIFFIEFLRKNLKFDNLKKFYFIFIVYFIISPLGYLIVSLSNEYKRTDYPGSEIARLVQNKWDDNFRNEIKIVVGDEWFAGNLSYHLNSRPEWIQEFGEKTSNLKSNHGVVYTGNPKILKKICPGVFGTIKPVGYCMIGQK